MNNSSSSNHGNLIKKPIPHQDVLSYLNRGKNTGSEEKTLQTGLARTAYTLLVI